MRFRSLTLAVALVCVARGSGAQSVGRMLVDDFKNVGGDMVAIWASPFKGAPRDWLLGGGALAVFGISMLADQSVADWAGRNESTGFLKKLEPVRHGGAIYTGKNVMPFVAGTYVVGLALKNQGARDAVMGCMSAWLAQSAIRKGTYVLVARERPDTSPNDPNRWAVPGKWSNWQKHSFPAGHFANVMSCATFWNKRFDMGVGGPLVYALAAAVGIGRIADAGHWTSDTVLGGILGYAVGKEVAHRSSRRHDERKASSAALNISPEFGGATLRVSWTF
jgi:hypothetical protein